MCNKGLHGKSSQQMERLLGDEQDSSPHALDIPYSADFEGHE